MDDLRDYKPVQPRGGGIQIRKTLERIGAIALLIGTTALKWGFVFVKFFGFFISVAAYTLWFHSWTFALGFVLMILVHELGHVFEARRQGLQVSWPTFIVWAIGAYRGSTMLEVLANIGFLLNAFNLLPIGFLDGGHILGSAREAWRMPVIRFEGNVPVQALAPERTRALLIVFIYLVLAAGLVLGMLATRPNGHI
jgi:Zn-dependent protease